ncbi:uncharacterized protein DNG_00219 [Cephalotrichum gorgonifer]|uniref:Uncharacterized protein n=1 Tax=Cephalotrichum gorgonifer TaxID=2041049 RepID=A0AAE8MNE1_9PEZI|nr:uncharacterized protein DNG_00219 [Cephalotrichum gorgonifer]
MAAPASKTINDLGGKWAMNYKLSDKPEEGLTLQGISWLTRKAISLATITLRVTVSQKPPSPPSTATEPVTHVDIEQIASGLTSTHEARCLDSVFRDHEDRIFGKVKGQSSFVSLDEIDDEFLRTGWLEGEAERTAPGGKDHLLSHVESVNGWTATQIWGFMEIEGERRYARNIVIKKGDKRVNMRLVYDYEGPLEEESEATN